MLKRFVIFMLLNAEGLPRGGGGCKDFMMTDDGKNIASWDSQDEAIEALRTRFPLRCNVAQVCDTNDNSFVELLLKRVWELPETPKSQQQQRGGGDQSRSDRERPQQQHSSNPPPPKGDGGGPSK